MTLAMVTAGAAGCARSTPPPLIAASTTMVTAWQVPQDPHNDPSLADPRLGEQIKWGYRIFTDTPREAPRLTGGKVSCVNCHLNAGQRDRALPLVGVAGMFPEYNNRAARLISLPDRIVDCFLRSENGTAHDAGQHPTTASKEVLAVAAYVTWLSRGYAVGANPAWRNKNAIAADKLIPIDKIDPAQRRGDLRRAVHLLPRRGRAGRADRRQEGRSALGAGLVERRGRSRARLHARGDRPLHDAVSEPGQPHGRTGAGSRRVHQLEAAAEIPVQGARLRRHENPGRRGLLSGERA